jgi:hypothetical protein
VSSSKAEPFSTREASITRPPALDHTMPANSSALEGYDPNDKVKLLPSYEELLRTTSVKLPRDKPVETSSPFIRLTGDIAKCTTDTLLVFPHTATDRNVDSLASPPNGVSQFSDGLEGYSQLRHGLEFTRDTFPGAPVSHLFQR